MTALRWLLALTWVVVSSALCSDASSAPLSACSPVVGRLVSSKGTVEVLRFGATEWRTAALELPICDGDTIRTARYSRTVLWISPENLIRLDESSVVSVATTKEEVLVEFLAPDDSISKVTCGRGYFISRFPRAFRVRTPYVNASVEGTEFIVSHHCTASTVTVFEGMVTAAPTDTRTRLRLERGESIAVGPDRPSVVPLRANLPDQVQWTIHVPRTSPVVQDQDLPKNACSDPSNQANCETARFQLLLAAGAISEAHEALTAIAERLGLESPLVLSYRSLLLLHNAPLPRDAVPDDPNAPSSRSKTSRARSLDLAKTAARTDPASPLAWLALSYAEQANLNLPGAAYGAEQAALTSGRQPLFLARWAETLLSAGESENALAIAEEASRHAPRDGRVKQVLGFSRLVRSNARDARIAFEEAIALDSSDPMSRLGLGISKIRTGDLAAGRTEIEIALALDPTNSLIRSYLGKAYFEERSAARTALALDQLALAKEADPLDPTPNFYTSAILQAINRPIDALDESKAASRLNDNRAVYRSRLALDSDLASRQTNRASTYADLGFNSLAFSEASTALALDFGNPSSHRFLAETLAQNPQLAISRESELLQAQIRSRGGLPPLEPLSGDSRGFALAGGAALDAGLNEYSTLWDRSAVGLGLRGLIGNRGTIGHHAAFYAFNDQVAVSMRDYQYQSEGFRPNNDIDQRFRDAFLRSTLGPDMLATVEVRSGSSELGDLPLRFFRNNWFDRRDDNEFDRVRASVFRSFSPKHDIAFTTSFQRAVFTTRVPSSGFSIEQRDDAAVYELQDTYRRERFSVISGIGYYNDARQVNISPDPIQRDTIEHLNAYAYGRLKHNDQLTVIGGVSGDKIDEIDGSRRQLNPKLGFVLTPTDSRWTFRGAAYRTAQRSLVAQQTLEPTQVAGFPQFFDLPNASDQRRAAFSGDLQVSSRTFAGVETSLRETKTTIVSSPTDVGYYTWRDVSVRGYLSHVLGQSTALTADYSFTKTSRPVDNPGEEEVVHALTHLLPISAKYWSGPWALETRLTFGSQRGQFLDLSGSPAQGKDDFCVGDLRITYSLPNRTGYFGMDVRNVSDRQFQYLEADPSNPRVAPRRMLTLRVYLFL